jgi:hypothetical protein
MADAMWTAFMIAGFLLGQVTVVKPDVMPNSISPIALTVKASEQRFTFLEGATTSDKVQSAEAFLGALELDAWAYAYEGFIVMDNERVDAFFIVGWARGLQKPMLIAQPWRATEGGSVVLLGPPALVESGPKGQVPVRLSAAQEQAIQAGVQRNQLLRNKKPAN